MKIIWSPLAFDRLREVADYIKEDNPEASVKWVRSIFSQIEKLKKYPKSGRIVPEMMRENVREIILNNYRIIYKIDNTSVIILTIRHARQLLPEYEII